MCNLFQIAERFQQRQKHIEKVCKENVISGPGVSRDNHIKQFVFGRLLYCRIHKVGSTFVGEIHKDTRKWQRENHVILGKTLPKSSISFAVLRDPYSRLVSGYVDKVLTFPSYYPTWGHTFMKLAGLLGPHSKWTDRCSIFMTFPQFIKYFIESERQFKHRESHFLPMHNQCDFCGGNYTFVGHIETIKEDMSYILKSLNITMDILPTKFHFQDKVKRMLVNERAYVEQCADMFTGLKTLWFTFHARGAIADWVHFPLTRDQCETITVDEFMEVVKDAQNKSKGKFDPSLQKRDTLVRMYRQVPLEDRIAVREVLKFDFLLSQSDPQPADIFPELS